MRVFFGIRMLMMLAVLGAPADDRTLHRHRTRRCEQVLQDCRSLE